MSYSQQPLIAALAAGRISGETTLPKRIETVISNVFVFPEKVYKFYKNDNEFFNAGFRDISSKAGRFAFTEKDFAWNNTLSPSIYIEISGIALKEDTAVLAPQEQAEELVIIMRKVDTNDILFEKILGNQVSVNEYRLIGEQLAENLKKIQEPVTNNFYNSFLERIEDIRVWMRSAPPEMPQEEAQSYCDLLVAFTEKNRHLFETDFSLDVTTDGDFHSHNALYEKETLRLMDTFPPKDAWGVGHRLFPFFRIGVDIWALSSDTQKFEAFRRGYETASGTSIDERLFDAFVVYVSCIAVSYLYMLALTDQEKRMPAERFHAFLRTFVSERKLI